MQISIFLYSLCIFIFYSLVIIGLASGCSIDVLNRLLRLVYDAIVLIVGIDEAKSQRNVERLKRELRVRK